MNHDFLGKGLKFPVQIQQRTGSLQVSSGSSSGHDHIHEAIIQILSTRPGERFMRPEFGSKLKDLVFEPNDQVLKGLIRHYIVAALKRWEKRVIITDISFGDSALNTDRHLLPVKISYRIIRSQVEGNLVYPFYREIS